jgi:hypothetical protein
MGSFPGIPWPAIGLCLALVTDVLTLAPLMLGGGMAIGAALLLMPDMTSPADWPLWDWRRFLFGELVVGPVFILAAAFELRAWLTASCRNNRGA